MDRQIRLIPSFVSLLFAAGFTLHLINLGVFVANGHTRLADIITPTLEFGLATWMTYCAFLLIVGAKRFWARFDLGVRAKAVYCVITFYVAASVPGHVSYLVTRDTTYFEAFPWWFSPLIMVVYVLFISFLLSLKGRTDA